MGSIHNISGLYFLFLLLLVDANSAVAQLKNESGRPFYTIYESQDYRATPQNWAIEQDSTGRIFIANNAGVLRFDGYNWDIARSLNGNLIRSLEKAPDGTIYFGGEGVFGRIGADTTGNTILISLLDLVPENYRDFTDIWNIVSTPSGVYFQAHEALFYLHVNRIEVLWQKNGDENGGNILNVGAQIFYQKTNEGVFVINGTEMEPIAGFESFPHRIAGIIEKQNNELLILTVNQGLYLFNGDSIKPINSEISEKLKSATCYKVLTLSSGNIAISTIYDGLYVINEQGEYVYSFNLNESANTGLIEDQTHGLWVALGNGVARLELESPLSKFDEDAGLNGFINDVIRFKGDIYAANLNGIHKLVTADLEPAYFTQIEGLQAHTLALSATEDYLLMGTTRGVYVYDGRTVSSITPRMLIVDIIPSKFREDMFFVVTENGFRTLTKTSGGWSLENPVTDFLPYPFTVLETADSTLWVGQTSEITKVRDLYSGDEPVTTTYSADEILSDRVEKYIYPIQFHDLILFGTPKGVYQLDENSGEFIPDSSFGIKYAAPGRDVYLAESLSDTTWYIRSFLNELLTQSADSAFTWDEISLLRMPEGTTNNVYYDPEGVLWLSTWNGLFRYDFNRTIERETQQKAHIHHVYETHKDSLIYGGHSEELFPEPVLTYYENSVRFQYGLPHFDALGENQFSYRLSGAEDSWSRWTKETQKDYTNLDPGTYTFEIKGKNLYRVDSIPARFTFTILPPWYLTNWAKTVYLILASGFIGLIAFVVSKIRTKRLEERNLQLEAEVAARTSEIAAQKKMIEENLAEKEVLLKEIHHRVKNNLQIIYSLLNLQKESITDEKVLDAIKTGQSRIRSMSMIHEILYQNNDLKRVELAPYLKNLVRHIEQSYQKEEVRTAFDMEPCEVDLNVAIPLGLTVNEVVTNAFKHAFKGKKNGLLSISASVKEGLLRLAIKDNGPGFDMDNEPFQQDETLGIMLIKDMVRQLKGTRELVTTSGTEYILHIPLPND